jgi:Trypsin-like peptidase domain
MAITIKHLDGPLKGDAHQTFDDNVDSVVFGRDPETCQVVYPPDYNVVGKKHFELRRGRAGDYTVGLFGQRYVGINANQADDDDPVASGDVFRLGRKDDGPSFDVEITKPASAILGPTGEQEIVVPRGERERKLRRQLIVGGGAIVVALIGVFGALYANHLRTSRIDYQLEAMADAAAENAKKQFSDAELDRLKNAVYLVAQRENDDYKPVATAWAFAADKVATNAHVAKAIAGGAPGEFVLFGPGGGEPIQIEKDVVWHSGYQTFKDYKPSVGKAQWGNFEPLNIISQYDVGILTVDLKTPLPKDPGTNKPVTLDLASADELDHLKPGDPVASVGFPTEGLAGVGVASEAPSEMHFGNISALTDVFMCRADPLHQLLIQHSVPVAGGASGSPLIDGRGNVIGLVTGGNTTGLKDDATGSTERLSNAALINFAARADLLDALRAGKDREQLADEESYWEEAGKRFANYFDSATKAFVALAKERYDVGDAETAEIGEGLLGKPDIKKATFVKVPYVLDGETKPGWKAERGFLYGFIAYSKSGVPIGINVTEKGSTEFLRDKLDPRKTSERELAPTAWVTVTKPTELEVSLWSFTDRPADYELYAYRWKLPDSSAAASAAPPLSP